MVDLETSNTPRIIIDSKNGLEPETVKALGHAAGAAEEVDNTQGPGLHNAILTVRISTMQDGPRGSIRPTATVEECFLACSPRVS
jgi:hypothetical protein